MPSLFFDRRLAGAYGERNRRKARSTGPKSAAGKARVARNALRHGLSVPGLQQPEWAPRIKDLAAALAGPGASRDRHEAALIMAAARIDLLRVRQARDALLVQVEALLTPSPVQDDTAAYD